MEKKLKNIARLTGFIVLAISVFFSYDGFDQSVNGANDNYTFLATLIGVILAVVVSVVQFIFGTSYKDLNWTLRITGVAAYVYSIYTNYLGIKHVLGADEFMAWASALFMDIYPEPAIAWSMGEALAGDLIGNIGKIMGLVEERPVQPVQKHGVFPNQNSNFKQNTQPKPDFQNFHNNFPKNFPKPIEKKKLVSPVFNQSYTDRFKVDGKRRP